MLINVLHLIDSAIRLCACMLVTQSCPTLCDPVDYIAHRAPLSSTTSWSLLKFIPLGWWCYPTISSSAAPFSCCLPSFPASGFSPMIQLFSSCGQCIGVSASASVLLMNIQGWFSLGPTGLISMLWRGFSRVFSSTTVWKHQFCAQPSLWFHIH